MKTISNYQIAKNTLRGISYDAKSRFKNDKPAIIMVINDSCDSICRDLNLSQNQTELLRNYACTLHP